MKLTREYLQGFIASETGRDIDLNPYEYDTKEYNDWWDGWMMSQYA